MNKMLSRVNGVDWKQRQNFLNLKKIFKHIIMESSWGLPNTVFKEVGEGVDMKLRPR